MANLAIKGHATRGNEVIALLEMLGGKNKVCLSADDEHLEYSINKESRVIQPVVNAYNDKIFTLEEFEEKFPYKVGDKVQHNGATSCGSVYVIEYMKWEDNQVKYVICDLYWNNCKCTVISKDLQPYKEETMEEKTYPPYMDYDVKTMKKEILPYFLTVYDSEENKHEIVATDGYEIKEENGKYYAVKKQYKYPKTYEECCNILVIDTHFCMKYLPHGTFSYKETIIYNLQELLVCRDAYWKIAGEQMGLDKPWEPDWSNAAQRKYCIVNTEGNVLKWVQKTTNKILAFPTEEMRDAFYENFKELIETCKELL